MKKYAYYSISYGTAVKKIIFPKYVEPQLYTAYTYPMHVCIKSIPYFLGLLFACFRLQNKIWLC